LLLTPTFIENEALPFIETAKARKSRGSWARKKGRGISTFGLKNGRLKRKRA
jgi:hypothetical protein